MDVPCPKSNGTDLQKVSLACEELLPTTHGPTQTMLTAQCGGVGTFRICRNTSAHLLSFETFVAQIPVATAASKSLLAARQQNRVAYKTFRAAS
jgi:hypothetical protein